MIHFEQVSLSYPHSQARQARPVLKDINLRIPRGELVCLLGSSGCGKTTLLNLAAGFLQPSSGRVLQAGKEITGPGPERGMVFQEATLFPWLTVAGNIGFALKQRGLSKKQRTEQVQHYLYLMQLENHAKKFPHALSGGMRQRVGIARVMAMESPLLLMDEPFSALDALTRERLQDALLAMHQGSRRTILYVTHCVAEATYLADRIIVLGNGSILSNSTLTTQEPRDRSSSSLITQQAILREILASPCTSNSATYQRIDI